MSFYTNSNKPFNALEITIKKTIPEVVLFSEAKLRNPNVPKVLFPLDTPIIKHTIVSRMFILMHFYIIWLSMIQNYSIGV